MKYKYEYILCIVKAHKHKRKPNVTVDWSDLISIRKVLNSNLDSEIGFSF
jgi:hypothetical protein